MPPAERAEFRAQCERSLDRPLSLRLRYGFVNLGAKRLRPRVNMGFASCREYREWCRRTYPRYSGMWPAEDDA